MKGPTPLETAEREISREVGYAFLKVDKMALGVAIGLVLGLLFLVVTAADLLVDVRGEVPLELLSQYFAGYSVSWGGAFVGFGWGFLVGSVAGWFIAFVHNFVMATWLIVVKARADLAATRDFLDHI